MHDNRPIGILDSGVGGLSVYIEVKKLLPLESFVYFADQENIPYGAKTKPELEKIVSRVVEFLIKKDVKMIIVACNTATVYTLDFLREKFPLPIIGTVPVVKTIVEATKTNKVAVFSTPATAKSNYLKELINNYGKDKEVIVIGDSKLEHIVEDGDISNPETKKIINKLFIPLIEKNVDSVALGCTHYPFLRKQIEEIVKGKIKIYDSGEAIARQVQKILTAENMLADKKNKDKFYTSSDVVRFKEVTGRVGLVLDQVEGVTI